MSEQTSPQYDYSVGFEVKATRYRGDAKSKSITLEPQELVFPEGRARDEAFSTVDALIEKPQVERTPSGHAIEFVILNDDHPGGELEIMHLEWHTAVRDPGVRPLLAALALTGRRRMVVSSFGMGQASPLPRSVARTMARTGSFVPAAEHLAPAYQRVVADYDSLSLSGTSEGARRAIGLTAIFDHVQSLFSHDGPGSRCFPRGWLGIGMAFLSESEHTKAYTAAAIDAELQKAQRNQDSLRRFGRSVLHQLRVGNLPNLLVSEPQAMSQAMLGADIKMALPHVQQRMVFSVPIFSRLNNPDDVYAIAADIGQASDAADGTEVITMSFPGTHSSGAANMPVTARLYELSHNV